MRVRRPGWLRAAAAAVCAASVTGAAAPDVPEAIAALGLDPAQARLWSDGLALERELQQRLFESDDAREGIAANLQKRKAEFTGN